MLYAFGNNVWRIGFWKDRVTLHGYALCYNNVNNLIKEGLYEDNEFKAENDGVVFEIN